MREQPDESAAVIATYQNGEAVSVLAERGEWAEVRTGSRSAWARKAGLTDAATIAQQEENPEPKFRIMPLPVSAPSAQGEIYIEADVNTDGDTDGDVVSRRTGWPCVSARTSTRLGSVRFIRPSASLPTSTRLIDHYLKNGTR